MAPSTSPLVCRSEPGEAPEDRPDMWEGEQFESIGNIAQYFTFVLAALAAGIGFFASQSYNGDADTYLLTATEYTDAALVRAEDGSLLSDE